MKVDLRKDNWELFLLLEDHFLKDTVFECLVTEVSSKRTGNGLPGLVEF